MFNDKGEKIKIAGPSMPVEIQGLSGVPDAGNEFTVLSDDKKAREISEYRQRKSRETELAKSSKVSLENVFEKLQEQELKELNIVLKVDVQGSVEALLEALNKLSTQEIRVNFVRTGIGAITESDVLLASASDAIIIGFNVKPSPQAKILAEQEHVDIRFYDVIYHAIEEIKSAMAGLLEPVYKEKTMGRAEVRDVFRITKVGTVAGSYVLEGLIPRNAKARLLRDNIVVYNGKIASLRRFKEDIKEVRAGYECGIGLESFNDIKKGDIIEAFVMEKEVPVFGEAISDVKGKEVSE
jgi:translation initiation factor IF-2